MRTLPSPATARHALAVVVVVCLAGLSACSGEAAEPGPSSSADPGVAQVQPGSPGEPAVTLDADAVLGAPGWNHDDLAFVQMMVPHHQQALQMAELAESRADSPEVAGLAARIEAAQGPEILLMAGWLGEQGVEVPGPGDDPSDWDHASHGHAGMAGMLDAEQMAALAAAEGVQFDRLFLEGMISHHEGAVEMAVDVLTAGQDRRVLELADDVNAGQSAEIARMRRMLDGLER
ncbi:lipoprotein [Nocardioides sp. OK12]|uniref:DUF305 domain-containing protein n=1 Tax=Nocardioides sp. OK12 TaxID=2758661 RepID=UPI0021C2C5A3|nr:DUF305 domain-containing protein [Nocardioides sp. OK12]GHJ61368.1 lipoprotein [Nocardioides sp. OK12]